MKQSIFGRAASLVRKPRAFAVLAATTALFAMAFGSSAYANATFSNSVANPTAGQQTPVSWSVATDGGFGSLHGATFQLPSGLQINWSGLTSLCSQEDAQGSDPISNCPTNSLHGSATLHTPLYDSIGATIAVDSGGALPELLIAATDPVTEEIVKLRFDTESINTYNGTAAMQFTDDAFGSLANADPQLTGLDFDLSANAASQHWFKVQSSTYCPSSSPGDAIVTLANDAKVNVMAEPTVYTGCGSTTTIGSGPADSSVDNGSSVTLSYSDSGTGTFTSFKCALIKLNDSSTWSSAPVTCGTTRSGSTKTYTGLEPGIYQFRVHSNSQPTKFDVRRFVVTTSDDPTASLSNPVSNGQTEFQIAASLDPGAGTLGNIEFHLPAQTTYYAPISDLSDCQAADFQGEDPLGECPAISQIGTATMESPLLEAPFTATVIVGDSGGAYPNVMLYANDPSLGIDSRTVLSTHFTAGIAGGNYIEFSDNVDAIGGSTPPVSGVDITFEGNAYGSAFKMLASCPTASSADAKLTAANGATMEVITPAISYGTGCGKPTTITSGPAEGSSGNASSVTFNYADTGAGSFTGFKCKLINFNVASTHSGAGTACGTTRSGESVTYTGLADGVYGFRVYNAYDHTSSDYRRFKVGE